jgi:hypothetical protein
MAITQQPSGAVQPLSAPAVAATQRALTPSRPPTLISRHEYALIDVDSYGSIPAPLTVAAHIPCYAEGQQHHTDQGDGSRQGFAPKHAGDDNDGEQDRQDYDCHNGDPSHYLSDGLHHSSLTALARLISAVPEKPPVPLARRHMVWRKNAAIWHLYAIVVVSSTERFKARLRQ